MNTAAADRAHERAMSGKCINLKDWEARALVAGATLIVRPIKGAMAGWVLGTGKEWMNSHDPPLGGFPRNCALFHCTDRLPMIGIPCPFGVPGDVLVGREKLRGDGQPGNRRTGIVRYGCDGEMVLPCCTCGLVLCKCTSGSSALVDCLWEWNRKSLSASQMPRWAARIRREVVSVRVIRIKQIQEDEAVATGIQPSKANVNLPKCFGWTVLPHASALANQWQRDHGKRYPWEVNHWAWLIEVK